jgi:putative radical SAM enzyme (TIGR03279 family)
MGEPTGGSTSWTREPRLIACSLWRFSGNKREYMVRVARVAADSIAQEIGIAPGTELLTVNGRQLADFLDWEFLTADDELVIEAREPDGEEIIYEIERPEGEPLGVELELPSVRRCANRCEFCFIEGLPKGLRKNLYIRDDDYRLSFAYGNFATLSNMKERDEQRIIEYRLSPLYVSVHATPWDARRALLNNPKVPNIVEQLTRLAAHGIQFHCQMVIVPGLNDGAVLEQSLTDLWDLGDAVLSVAVVPVGLTQFSHLYTGESMSPDRARELLEVVERWATRASAQRGEPWLFGSDELYLLAGLDLPAASHYGDFSQIENGVGAVTSLRERVRDGAAGLPRLDGKRIGVVTGTSMAPLMPELLGQLHASTGAAFVLIPTTNSLFGPTTTTAGLLVGADIRRALDGRSDLDLALIPAETINDGGLFLDDERFVMVRETLPMPVYPSYDFIDVLSLEGQGTPLVPGARAA